MKKILLVPFLLLATLTSFATTPKITVVDFSFPPSAITFPLEDNGLWTWFNATVNVTSDILPTSAVPWGSDNTCPAPVEFSEVSAINSTSLFHSFPVPAHSQLHIQFQQAGQPTTVTVVDRTGNQVLKEQYTSVSEATLPLQNIPNGAYTIIVEQGDTMDMQRVAIAH